MSMLLGSGVIYIFGRRGRDTLNSEGSVKKCRDVPSSDITPLWLILHDGLFLLGHVQV